MKNKKKNRDENEEEKENYLPMLANKYDERKKYLKLPGAISRKLDGIRAMIRISKNNQLIISSRTNKEFSNLDTLRLQSSFLFKKFPNIVFDGELYSHEIPFNDISGCVRSIKNKSKYDDAIEYFMFDLFNRDDPNMSYYDRMELQKKVEYEYNKIVPEKDRKIKFEYYEIIKAHEDVQKFHDKFVGEGYEGVILRNLYNSPYMFKNRSNDLLKYKNFEDTEFKITDYKQGCGTDERMCYF